MRPLEQFLLVSSFILCSTLVSAERYMVTEDSFGGYSAEQVIEPEGSERPLSTPSSNDNTVDPQDQSPTSQDNAAPKKLAEVNESQDQTVDEKKPLSVFERKYLEAEQQAQKDIIEKLGKNKGARGYDATEINEADFVDGDALLNQPSDSSDLPNENQRFFTTVDSDGNVINTPYDPVLEQEAWEKYREKQPAFTEARIFRKAAPDDLIKEPVLPDQVDPVAMQILTSGKEQADSYFEAFSQGCCTGLPSSKTTDLLPGLSYSFDLEADDLPYRFNEGDSRYLLLRLPELTENYPLLIRSFIRKYKRNGIDHGVFFPQLVTLDKDRNPLRIITGPLLKYVAETWTTYGYLEGFFEIEQTKDSEERYILINTTREVLRLSSVIDDGENSLQITHMPTGLFEIKLPEQN